MRKKLSLILLCSSWLLAMTQVKQLSTLKLELRDGTVLKVPRHLAELSETILGTLELIDDDRPISLPQLTEADWELVYEHLALASRVTTEKTEGARQALLASLGKLSAEVLLSCMMIVDYLAVPVVFEACLELAYAGHLNVLSYEQLCQLQPYYVHEIIFRRACAACGPYKAAQLAVCKGHRAAVNTVCVTRNGSIVSGARDSTVRLWDMEGNQLALRSHGMRLNSSVDAISTTKDGKIAYGYSDGALSIWDTEGNPLRRGLEALDNTFYTTQDGKIVYRYSERKMSIGDTGVDHLTVRYGHKAWVNTVCTIPDGKIVYGYADGKISIWNAEINELTVWSGHEDSVKAVCITPDGKIISGSNDRTIRVWDTEGNLLAVCEGHEGKVIACCVAKNGKIVSGSWDKTVRVWDTDGNQLAVCKGHEHWVNAVCITKNGKIVSGSSDGTVRVWDTEGNQLAVCEGHEGDVIAVCISHNGKIISGSYDKTVRLWDIQGNQLAICKGHYNRVTAVCVTGNGTIVSGSFDKTVRTWNASLSLTDEQAEKAWVYLQENPEVNHQYGWNYLKNILQGHEELPSNEGLFIEKAKKRLF